MFGDRRSLGALLISALLHVAVAVGVGVSGRAYAARAHDELQRPDAWSGNTFDHDAVLAQAAALPAPDPPAAPAAPAAPRVVAPAPEAARPRPVRAAPPTPPADPKPAEPEPADPEGHTPSDRSAHDPKASADSERGEASPSAAETPATYGAAGPAVERTLAKAFTRAIPAAVSKDPVWSELPFGPAGSMRVEITIDDEGRIESAEPERRPARQLQRLLDRTLILLRSGRFALDRGNGAGTEVLELEATISERPVTSDDFKSPLDPLELGFVPPSATKAGRAYFTLASGRHVEISIKLVPPPG
jgi:hypothetical protein